VTPNQDMTQRPSPDLIDIFIILLLAASIDIFIFTIAAQFINSAAFQRLPAFVTDAYSSIWASVVSGGAGIGLVIIKSLSARRAQKPNYLLFVSIAAAALLAAILGIAIVSQHLNPRPPIYPPPGVALIDTSKISNSAAEFEFDSLPGGPMVSYRLTGTYQVKGSEVSGHLKGGFLTTTESFAPLFPMSITRLVFRSCYIHPVGGIDQMDIFPAIGKARNSKDLDIKLEKNKTYEFPEMDFIFDLPPDFQPNRIWLCAGMENGAGYFPAQ
jgi:hypothetical protein